MRKLTRIGSGKLSDKTKFRLKVVDWYFRESSRFSSSGKPDTSLTCRHLGIHRSYFYRWKARYDRKRLASQENRSIASARKREPRVGKPTAYTRELVKAVRELRQADTTYSAKKTRPML